MPRHPFLIDFNIGATSISEVVFLNLRADILWDWADIIGGFGRLGGDYHRLRGHHEILENLSGHLTGLGGHNRLIW